MIRHNLTKDFPKEYLTFRLFNRRCNNPNAPDFYLYGGRGITVCSEWKISSDDSDDIIKKKFLSFYNHIGDAPTLKHTIDRIDNEKGYEPSNVRWATQKEQRNNCRSNHILTFSGKSLTISQWAEQEEVKALDITEKTIRGRVAANWKTNAIFTTPKINTQGKRVLQIDPSTNKIVNTFPSQHAAAKYVGGHQANIYKACTGKIKHSNGFIWRYAS